MRSNKFPSPRNILADVAIRPSPSPNVYKRRDVIRGLRKSLMSKCAKVIEKAKETNITNDKKFKVLPTVVVFYSRICLLSTQINSM